MDRRGDHESVIAGGRYGNRRQRASRHWLQPGGNVNGRLPFKVCHCHQLTARLKLADELSAIRTALNSRISQVAQAQHGRAPFL